MIIYVIVKSLLLVLCTKIKQEARGRDGYYYLSAILVLRPGAECFILRIASTWQGNDLSFMKNYLNIHSPPLNIPSLFCWLCWTIKYIKSGQNWLCSNTLLSYPVLKGLRKTFWEPFSCLPYTYPVLQLYKWNNIALFTPHSAVWTI